MRAKQLRWRGNKALPEQRSCRSRHVACGVRASLSKKPKIAVVGAGVIGLSSALRIKQSMPDADVEVVAERFFQDTTSHGSGGLWEPYVLADTPQHLVHQWGLSTFQFYDDLFFGRHSTQHASHGVQLVSAIQLWTKADSERQIPYWHDIVYNFRRMPSVEARRLNARAADGWTFNTYVTDPRYHLRWLASSCSDAGIEFQQSRVNDWHALHELTKADVIVNCSALGAATLCEDASLRPVRGQVIRVRAPWVKHVWFLDEVTYVIPNVDNVVLGGTQQVDDYNTAVRVTDTEDILSRCALLLPELRSAVIEQEWAGLRPSRNSVRLDAEVCDIGRRKIAIVHNYGHGGSGMTLHWGCAAHVVQLVQEALH